jgi:hypothetical protein
MMVFGKPSNESGNRQSETAAFKSEKLVSRHARPLDKTAAKFQRLFMGFRGQSSSISLSTAAILDFRFQLHQLHAYQRHCVPLPWNMGGYLPGGHLTATPFTGQR